MILNSYEIILGVSCFLAYDLLVIWVNVNSIPPYGGRKEKKNEQRIKKTSM
jgi:hypothetical protein